MWVVWCTWPNEGVYVYVSAVLELNEEDTQENGDPNVDDQTQFEINLKDTRFVTDLVRF